MARRGRGEGTVYRRADGRWEAAFGSTAVVNAMSGGPSERFGSSCWRPAGHSSRVSFSRVPASALRST